MRQSFARSDKRPYAKTTPGLSPRSPEELVGSANGRLMDALERFALAYANNTQDLRLYSIALLSRYRELQATHASAFPPKVRKA